MTDTAATRQTAHDTTFAVLFAISFCHLLNDMMQALLPAIYPTLKARFPSELRPDRPDDPGLPDAPPRCCSRWWAISPTRGPCPIRWRLGMVSTLIGLLVLSHGASLSACCCWRPC